MFSYPCCCQGLLPIYSANRWSSFLDYFLQEIKPATLIASSKKRIGYIHKWLFVFLGNVQWSRSRIDCAYLWHRLRLSCSDMLQASSRPKYSASCCDCRLGVEIVESPQGSGHCLITSSKKSLTACDTAATACCAGLACTRQINSKGLETHGV